MNVMIKSIFAFNSVMDNNFPKFLTCLILQNTVIRTFID
jgi:hypothetical protein